MRTTTHFLFLTLTLLFGARTAHAEGTKQLSPTANDTTILVVNNGAYGNFASVGGPASSRLNFRLASPGSEQVLLGFSRAFTSNFRLDATYPSVDYYFRIMAPNGTVARNWELISTATANLNTFAQVTAGPNTLAGTGGYVPFVFTPASGAIAGDYYVEFSTVNTGAAGTAFNLPRFDVTIATRGATPAELPGRVFSLNWAIGAPQTKDAVAPYGNFDREFKGNFFVYSPEGFVSRINFATAGFRPYLFNISLNGTGTIDFLSPLNNLRSVDGERRTNPKFQIFLQAPPAALYPSGDFGTMITNSDYPRLYGCPAGDKYYVEVAVTKAGQVEVLIDRDGNDQKFTPGTADRILSLDIAPRAGESAPYVRQVPWDGKDGFGTVVATVPNLASRITFSQVPYHLPIYDAEYLTNGINVQIVRPAAPGGYTFTYQWDDRNIFEDAPAGKRKTELEGCTSGCHTWENYDYGNENTINTYWFARRQAEVRALNRANPACGCSASGTLTIGGVVYNDKNGSKTNNAGETGYPGVRAYLYGDANANGVIDAGETVSKNSTTNASGEFAFTVNTTGTPGSATRTPTSLNATAIDLGPGFTAANRHRTTEYGFGAITTGGVNYTATSSIHLTGVNIPKGAIITSAVLKVRGGVQVTTGTFASGANKLRIYAASEPNPAIPSQANPAGDRSRTATNVQWDFAAAPVSGTDYTSPSLVDVLQELVQTSTYASNDNILLLVQGVGAFNEFQRFGDAAPPQLTVGYTLYNLPQNYVIRVDARDVPAGNLITTDTSRAVALNTPSDYSCFNDFGFGADRDGDKVVDGIDLDNDNDGIPDAQEDGGSGFSPTADADKDGIPNYLDTDNNTGGAGTTALVFKDVNNDGINDVYDTDGDGVIDAFDLDSDNDGIVDLVEAGGVDADGDGVVDAKTDTDGDGLADVYDNNDTDGPIGSGVDATTPSTSVLVDRNADGVTDGGDADGDGVPNYRDRDSDNDGLTDAREAGAADANGDGIVDGFADADGDGIANAYDNAHTGPKATAANKPAVMGVPLVSKDSDRDGRPDYLDVDSDGDGIADIVEAGGTDADGNGRVDSFADADGDGLANVYDPAHDGPKRTAGNAPATAGAALPTVDTDGDGVPNRLDRDSDNDGISDAVEAGATDVDGDGRVDATADADGDGLANVYDKTHDGPDRTINAAPTAGVPLAITGANNPAQPGQPLTTCPGCDADKDGLPSWLDLDTDNDNVADVVEQGGTDANGDGRADNFSDADGDGLGDRVDGDADNDGTAENTANALVTTGADTNNDGRPNSYPKGDADKDGRLNSQDLDSDNDGIADVTEAGGTDVNGDGRADGFADADKDGLSDAVDGDPTNVLPKGSDNSGANSANALVRTGADANADGRPDTIGNAKDTDGDGIADRLDLDSDNDGIADIIEAKGTDKNGDGRVDADTFADADNDGFDDNVDADPSNALPLGSNAAGSNNARVLVKTGADTNGDARPNSVPAAIDVDGDGIADYLDLDTDNDGIPDLVEAMGADANGEGRVDNAADLDKDGLADVVDGDNDLTTALNDGNGGLVKTDATGRVIDTRAAQGNDFDGDGFPNWTDRDSDNDGISDLTEAGISAAKDLNADGRIDQTAGYDANGDGLADAFTGTPAVQTLADANGDGTIVTEGFAVGSRGKDADGRPNYRDLDSDNDGITDNVEQNAGSTSNDLSGGTIDGKMTHAGVDYVANNGTTPLDSDGDGLPDYLDIDADNDGIRDNFEGVCSACPSAGVTGGADANNNGVLDVFENLNSANGTGGSNVGATPENTDGTDVVDYLDGDSDNDGEADYGEGFDLNGNGISLDDYKVIASNYGTANSSTLYNNAADTDGDGIPDWLDNQPGVAGYDKTKRPPFQTPGNAFYRDANDNGLADLVEADMGGTDSTRPDGNGTGDRDWRDNTSAVPLPVVILSFEAKPEACEVTVRWTVARESNLAGYTVEGSTDGSLFAAFAKTQATGAAAYSVRVKGAPAGQLYLRLRSTDLDGTSELSETIVVTGERCGGGDALTAAPNPVAAGHTLAVESILGGPVELIDVTGRIVYRGVLGAGERTDVSTAGLPAGLYVLHSGEQTVRVVVLQ